MTRFYAIAAATLLVSACADTVPVDQFEPDRSVAEQGGVNAGGSLGPSPSQANPAQSAIASLNLQAVTTGDFGAEIDRRRSCTFTSSAGQLLLVAEAPLGIRSRPRAVVRLTGGVQSLDAMRDGGYSYLTEGPAFQTRQGLTITIVQDENAAAPVPVPAPGPEMAGGEVGEPVEAVNTAQSWPATMTVIAEGAEQEYPLGVYTCGV